MAVNCRVILRDPKHSSGATEQEKKRDRFDAFKRMLGAFRKLSEQDCKIPNEVKRRQYFESKSEKKRRKIKENKVKK